MKIYFFPRTKIGQWSVILIALWPFLTILGTVIVNLLYPGVEAGNGIIDDLSIRPALAITMLLGFASGVVGFTISLFSIFKKMERSLFVFLSALIGLFLVVLLFGELFIEH